MIKFEKTTPSDAHSLAEVSKRSFDSDIHCGASNPGGPPGYDSPEWQTSMMNKATAYYKILLDKKIVGGFIIFKVSNGHYELGRIFIDSDFHNHGIGTKAMEFMWKEFSDAMKWSLDTPAWNTRTKYFYTKIGFSIVQEKNGFIFFEKK
ncbi:MAG: GNAT family N-acetyltransferase [Halanaerobiales bacterium]|nr:GNAT family N-acetyltransferase [Halanaerobiales bacterium]